VSKVITSPVKRWPGTVTLKTTLTLPEAEAINETREVFRSWAEGAKVTFFSLDKPRIPSIIACVEKWELADFPETPTLSNFPMSPEQSRHKLIEWIWNEIKSVYDEEEEIPNE
jgi:hypothetical protein